MFGFLKPYQAMKNNNHKTCMNVLESIGKTKINRFKRLIRSSGTTFSATEFDIIQWLITQCFVFVSVYVFVPETSYHHWFSNGSYESSFSKLKMIKSYLRSTISKSRLSALSVNFT